MDNNVNNGSIVFFRGRDVWITPTDLRIILDDGGFTAVQVPTLDPVVRARACASEFRSSRLTGRQTRIEVLAAEADYIEFGILFREEIAAGRGGEVRWTQQDRVVYGTAAGGGWSVPGSREGAAFVAQAQRWQTHVDYRWVRDRFVLPGLAALGAFLVSPSGGLYYVGPEGQADLERYRATVRRMGASQLHRIVLGDDPDSKAAIGDAAVDALSGAVADVRDRLEAWRGRANGRASSLGTMTVELADIRARAESLSVLLGFGVDAIAEAIAEVNEELRAAVDGQPAVERDASGPTTVRARKPTSMVMLAVDVLRREARPMPYRELTTAVLAAGWQTQGKTPWETLNAQLCVWARDPGCPVYRTQPGTWAIRPEPESAPESAVEPESTPEPAVEQVPEPDPALARLDAWSDRASDLVGATLTVEPDDGFPTAEELELADGRQLATWCKAHGVRGYVRLTTTERRAALVALRGAAAEA